MVHPHSTLVVTINGSGFAIELVYLLLFLIYSDRKKRLQVLLIMLAEFVFIAVLALLVLTLTHSIKLRSAIVGSICIFGCFLMYASPLSIMVPNGMGLVLGIAQLVLYAAFYKSTKQQIAARQSKVELGLADAAVSADSKKIRSEPPNRAGGI
ncbi:hypothetical protein RJ639_035827 [Escallonia herrerae]|uniref:Uncharacterized protein n=1 Tax=Escallonia herrerae TaxID=1293975 RepID=A0AA88WTD7_9ASTE|nr:hypothetical protein RJ639_035827 [Escallonia herrerae]